MTHHRPTLVVIVCHHAGPAGLLGLPEEDMHRRARQESASNQGQWAAEFRKQFEPYDWTKMLG